VSALAKQPQKIRIGFLRGSPPPISPLRLAKNLKLSGLWPGASCNPLAKLALAAIAAAPSWLSDGDPAGLHRMGYWDADDVARRIRESGLRLPALASAKKGSA
jgi:hypothetical protein